MAISSMGYYSGQNEMFMRDESTSNSLAAMLSPCLPQVDLQARRYGGGNLEDDGRVQGVGQKRPSFATNDSTTVEDGAEDGDEGTASASHLEKKRRLTLDQVRSLERNFEVENKLEPDRKMQLAKELGMRPRQVAVWFQNRRARWKTKQLERDYETLEAGFKRLKADYELVLDEKNYLKAELQRLSGDTLGYKQGDDNQGAESSKIPERDLDVSISVARQHNARASPTVDTSLAKEETRGSTDGSSSDIVDADSPRSTDSSRISAIQSHDFPPESFMVHPELLQIYSEETLHPDSAVKLEDGFHEDQSCNYLLLHLDHQSGVLPWWD